MLPSSAKDFANPEIADYIDRSQSSVGPETQERVKLFKLAWDAIGSEFASRHIQFELFYAGARIRGAEQLIPHLRLGPGHGHGGRPAGQLRAAGINGAYRRKSWSNWTRIPSGS